MIDPDTAQQRRMYEVAHPYVTPFLLTPGDE